MSTPYSACTQARLLELLDYVPATGYFFWRKDKARAKSGQRAGYLGAGGYWRIKIDSYKYPAHRLACLYMEGKYPPHEVDHTNGDRKDNRWDNLRHATRKQNQENKHDNPMRGITAHRWGTFTVRIKHAQKHINLGTYSTLEEAQRVRKEVERALFTHSSACSIPPGSP